MDPSQLNNNYQKDMANKNEYKHNGNEHYNTSSFLSLMPQWSSSSIGNLMNSIISSNANNSALLNRSLTFQNNSTIKKNMLLQKNNTSYTDSAFKNNLVSQNICSSQNNLTSQNDISQNFLSLQKNITLHTNSVFKNNLVSQNNVGSQNNLFSQNNLASQNNLELQRNITSHTDLDVKKKLTSQNICAPRSNLASQSNLINLNNFISRNNAAVQNNSTSRNIWGIQNNSVSQTNFTSQNNLNSQINLDSQTSSINYHDFTSQHNNLSSQHKFIYFKDIVTQSQLLPQYYLPSHIILNDRIDNPVFTLTDCPPINSNIRQGESSNNQFSDHTMRPLQKIGRLYTGSNSEYKMSPNEFPQLPGTESANNYVMSTTIKGNQQLKKDAFKKVEKSKNKNKLGASIDVRNRMGKTNNNKQTIIYSNSNIDAHKNIKAVVNTKFETSVQTSNKDSTSKVICDQFGMGGIISTLKSASSNPGLVELALGEDLTELVVDLNSPTDLVPTFDGPFTKFPIAPHNEIINETPSEYIISDLIKHKIASLNMSKYGDDMLFYLFYSYYGDEIQLLAAKQLRERGWRFHTVLLVWISHIEGTFKQITEGYENATFNVFDQYVWKTIPRKMTIDYSKLEGHGVKLTV